MIIYDFTPGVDKIALSTIWLDMGRRIYRKYPLRSEDVSYIQGTGDLSSHRRVVINNAQTLDRGWTDGGVASCVIKYRCLIDCKSY